MMDEDFHKFLSWEIIQTSGPVFQSFFYLPLSYLSNLIRITLFVAFPGSKDWWPILGHQNVLSPENPSASDTHQNTMNKSCLTWSFKDKRGGGYKTMECRKVKRARRVSSKNERKRHQMQLQSSHSWLQLHRDNFWLPERPSIELC